MSYVFAYENRISGQLNPVLVYYFHANVSTSLLAWNALNFLLPMVSMTPNQP